MFIDFHRGLVNPSIAGNEKGSCEIRPYINCILLVIIHVRMYTQHNNVFIVMRLLRRLRLNKACNWRIIRGNIFRWNFFPAAVNFCKQTLIASRRFKTHDFNPRQRRCEAENAIRRENFMTLLRILCEFCTVRYCTCCCVFACIVVVVVVCWSRYNAENLHAVKFRIYFCTFYGAILVHRCADCWPSRFTWRRYETKT